MSEHDENSMFFAPRVKATFRLGKEVYPVDPKSGILSEQLTAMKEESMKILKEYITSHNAPIDVPDEPIEASSEEEEGGEEKNPPKKSKQQK
ncbi:hypothetical protein KSP39_PZI022534 [Platanthera zijinensis]|uniref:Uncharacterized protein n=1 Tax=Platanthera zijinensis TaxID=2320716 RepID=A0AAP0FUV7_9ASPA